MTANGNEKLGIRILGANGKPLWVRVVLPRMTIILEPSEDGRLVLISAFSRGGREKEISLENIPIEHQRKIIKKATLLWQEALRETTST